MYSIVSCLSVSRSWENARIFESWTVLFVPKMELK